MTSCALKVCECLVFLACLAIAEPAIFVSALLSEADMPPKTTKPDKQQVRDWVNRRQVEQEPPSMEDIRRELGWDLLPSNKKRERDRNE